METHANFWKRVDREYRILMLASDGSITSREVADRLDVHPSTASRLLTNLYRKGALRRKWIKFQGGAPGGQYCYSTGRSIKMSS
jgi:predicted transcriptional regulator